MNNDPRLQMREFMLERIRRLAALRADVQRLRYLKRAEKAARYNQPGMPSFLKVQAE